MKQELILTISDLEKLNKIDSQYKSSLYSFNLYKHLYFSRSEKELGKQKVEQNINIRNKFWWILGENTEIAFFNLSILQLCSILKNKPKNDELSIYSIKSIISTEIMQKIEKLNDNHGSDLKNYRDILGHLFNELKLIKINISPNLSPSSIDEIFIELGNILNEIKTLNNKPTFLYSGYSKNIKSNYKELFNLLDKTDKK